MLLRLGLETYPHHAAADNDRLALMDVGSPDGYRAQLARIFGFEAGVEAALSGVLGAQLVRDRAKADRLRRDMRAMGMTADDVAYLPQYSLRLASAAQALGWLFVLERHTLIAGLIRRQLEYRFGSAVANATSYLAAYGASPGARFRSLCAALDDHAARRPDWPALVVAGAMEAFRSQRQWYLATRSERDTESEPVRAVVEPPQSWLGPPSAAASTR
ncbi:MAG TPA: biliverdin-producing heme oxygenase [Kofleriaceae bacterium]